METAGSYFTLLKTKALINAWLERKNNFVFNKIFASLRFFLETSGQQFFSLWDFNKNLYLKIEIVVLFSRRFYVCVFFVETAGPI